MITNDVGIESSKPWKAMVSADKRLMARSTRTREGCLVWTGARGKTGYGRIRGPDGRMMYTHKLAWEIARGPVPPGRFLDHKCRVRLCLDVEHLEVVTTAENNRRASGTKLSEDRAAQIRQMIAAGHHHRELATMFGVSRSTISMLATGRIWR